MYFGSPRDRKGDERSQEIQLFAGANRREQFGASGMYLKSRSITGSDLELLPQVSTRSAHLSIRDER